MEQEGVREAGPRHTGPRLRSPRPLLLTGPPPTLPLSLTQMCPAAACGLDHCGGGGTHSPCGPRGVLWIVRFFPNVPPPCVSMGVSNLLQSVSGTGAARRLLPRAGGKARRAGEGSEPSPVCLCVVQCLQRRGAQGRGNKGGRVSEDSPSWASQTSVHLLCLDQGQFPRRQPSLLLEAQKSLLIPLSRWLEALTRTRSCPHGASVSSVSGELHLRRGAPQPRRMATLYIHARPGQMDAWLLPGPAARPCLQAAHAQRVRRSVLTEIHDPDASGTPKSPRLAGLLLRGKQTRLREGRKVRLQRPGWHWRSGVLPTGS